MLEEREKEAQTLGERLARLIEVFNTVAADDLSPLGPLAAETFGPGVLASRKRVESALRARILHLYQARAVILAELVRNLGDAGLLAGEAQDAVLSLPSTAERRAFMAETVEEQAAYILMGHMLSAMLETGQGLLGETRPAPAPGPKARRRRIDPLIRTLEVHDRLARGWFHYAENLAESGRLTLAHLGAVLKFEPLDAARLEEKYGFSLDVVRHSIESAKMHYTHGRQHIERLKKTRAQPIFKSRVN